MFTGLVEVMASIVELRPLAPGYRLVIDAGHLAEGAAIGDSIAVNGCCLTVVENQQGRLAFDAGPETLQRTNLGQLAKGRRVNLERSLRVGDRMGGHFVTGHIDAVGTLDSREDLGDWSNFWFAVPPELTRQMASKGSIAVDGVSLTLVDVEPARFSVQLIPHTLTVTTLGDLGIGSRVNLETDLLAKYAQRLVTPELGS
jgi:riboflavin synthase